MSFPRETFNLPVGPKAAFTLVPLNPREEVFTITSISPVLFLAIEPVSTTILPFETFDLNLGSSFEFSKSLTTRDVSSFIIIVVSSLNCNVIDEFSVVKISSLENI